MQEPDIEGVEHIDSPKVDIKSSGEKSDTGQKLVEFGNQGDLLFSDQGDLRRAANLLMQTKTAPKHLADGGTTAIAAALLLCRQKNLPVSAMNEMAYIYGKITVFGTLYTALAEKHPEYGEQEIFYIDESGERICYENKNLKLAPWACIIKSRKRASSIWNEFSFSTEDARAAKLLTQSTKDESTWKKYLKDMLYHKAKKRCFDAQYASAVHGIDCYEEASYRDVEDSSAVEEFNKRLGLNNEP